MSKNAKKPEELGQKQGDENPKQGEGAQPAAPKNKNAERAKRIFANYPNAKTLYFTSDGTPFFKENDAMNHAKSLKDKTVTPINR